MLSEKFCTKCGLTKSAIDFYERLIRGKEYLSSYCISCHINYTNNKHKDNDPQIKSIILEAKSKPCVDCGEQHPHWAMDFDHLDPGDKVFSIAKAIARSASEKTLLAEIAKCELVCALCHRYRTYGVKRTRKEDNVIST